MRSADAELIARCRHGDLSAFEELYRQHASRLYALACRMAPTRADAEDLLQEIFLLAHRKLGTFKGESALSTWLYRLGMNVCLDFVRSRQGRSGRLTDSLDDEEPGAPAMPQTPPLDAVSRIDLERAIAELPPGSRAAFLLHDVEGFEHHEIAAILGVSAGTSKSQVHKARRKIRSLLGRPAPRVSGRP
ncbi:MAG TPA: sigma-70 family RNA polymerase sigma factor [Vicinamibacterales bacterium]